VDCFVASLLATTNAPDLFASGHAAAASINTSLTFARLFGHSARNFVRRALIVTVKK
jgi:hypothetical protein